MNIKKYSKTEDKITSLIIGIIVLITCIFPAQALATGVCEHVLTYHEATEATCETDGSKEYWTCDNCGEIFGDSEGQNTTTLDELKIKAVGHDYLIYETKDPTTTAEGYNKEKCSKCGNIKTETIAKLDVSKRWKQSHDPSSNDKVVIKVQDNRWTKAYTFATYTRSQLDKAIGQVMRVYSFRDKVGCGYCISKGYDFKTFLNYVFRNNQDFLTVLNNTGNDKILFSFEASDSYKNTTTYSCANLFGSRYFYKDLCCSSNPSGSLVAPMLAVYEARAKNQDVSYDECTNFSEANDSHSLRITFGQASPNDSTAGNSIAEIETIIIRLNGAYALNVTDSKGNSVTNGIEIGIDGDNQLKASFTAKDFASIVTQTAPTDPTDFEYIVAAGSRNILSISKDGKIIAKKKGTATVTVRYKWADSGDDTSSMTFTIKVGDKSTGSGGGSGGGNGSGKGDGNGDGDGTGKGDGTGTLSGTGTSETSGGGGDSTSTTPVLLTTNGKSVGSIKSITLTSAGDGSDTSSSSGGSQGGGTLAVSLKKQNSLELWITIIIAVLMLISGIASKLINYQNQTGRITLLLNRWFKKGK